MKELRVIFLFLVCYSSGVFAFKLLIRYGNEKYPIYNWASRKVYIWEGFSFLSWFGLAFYSLIIMLYNIGRFFIWIAQTKKDDTTEKEHQ